MVRIDRASYRAGFVERLGEAGRLPAITIWIEHDEGDVEIVLYNRAILLLTTDSEAVRRIHEVCCPLMVSPHDTAGRSFPPSSLRWSSPCPDGVSDVVGDFPFGGDPRQRAARSEEHTSELQSLAYLVCRLLLEKKKNNIQQGRS